MEERKDEINLLEEMEKDPIISQRELSQRTGLSLGMVNILVKKCIKTGLVKVESLNARSVKYILTPKGINEKTKKTLRYIKRSYKFILDISSKIEERAKNDLDQGKKIYIYGEEDEIMEIVREILSRNSISYTLLDNLESTMNCRDLAIYIWDVDIDTDIESKVEGLELVNILNL